MNGLRQIIARCLLTVLLLQISDGAPVTFDTVCTHKVADIVFALDTSYSLWEDDFNEQLKFVQNLVYQFPVSPDGVHVGVLTFGSHVYPQFLLNDYYSKDDVNQAIANIQYKAGSTITASAIRHAREHMFSVENGGREGVEKIMFVITDGLSADRHNTSLEASISKKAGIKILVIGVGVNDTELKDISSRPTEHANFLFMVKDFKALGTIQDVVTQTACDAMTERLPNDSTDGIDVVKYCGGKEADIIFIVDSSSSLSAENHRRILSFISDMVGLLDIDSGSTRVGLISYSDVVDPVILLDNGLSKQYLRLLILQTRHEGGRTKTHLALEYLHKHGFIYAHERVNAAKVAILITDGQSENPLQNIKESEKLQMKGVHVFVLGLSTDTDMKELQTIASTPYKDHVLGADVYDALQAMKDTLALSVCKEADEQANNVQNDRGVVNGTKTQKPKHRDVTPLNNEDSTHCHPDKAVDVMYLYDSNSISSKSANEVRDAITKFMITTHNYNVRSGIASRSCKGYMDPGLMTSPNNEIITGKVITLQDDVLPEMLHDLRIKGFSARNGGRPNARRVAFLIIDGDLRFYNKIYTEANRLRFKERVELFVITTSTSNTHHITEIVTRPAKDHIFNIVNFAHLEMLKSKIFNIICAS